MRRWCRSSPDTPMRCAWRCATASCGGSGTPRCRRRTDAGRDRASARAATPPARMLPFAVLDDAGVPCSACTSYHEHRRRRNQRRRDRHTWYAAALPAHRTSTPTCKLLLLTHAFERAGLHRGRLRTDNFNFASQRAHRAPGRQAWTACCAATSSRRDGTPARHRACTASIAGEWPAVQGAPALAAARTRPRTPSLTAIERAEPTADADRLLLHPARGQAAGVRQGVPDAARGAEGRRGRTTATARRSTTSTTSRAPRW